MTVAIRRPVARAPFHTDPVSIGFRFAVSRDRRGTSTSGTSLEPSELTSRSSSRSACTFALPRARPAWELGDLGLGLRQAYIFRGPCSSGAACRRWRMTPQALAMINPICCRTESPRPDSPSSGPARSASIGRGDCDHAANGDRQGGIRPSGPTCHQKHCASRHQGRDGHATHRIR